ncbi:enoyl-CoA hydratase-related protein [Sphingomonas adhaesiva]|uniref:enoyl-CoA hydratase-related protein n=1 Tax=Sphingomonas adhaesiva TaxID=28212 RepID=UPI002FFAB0F4
MAYEQIDYAVDGAVATITLHRPDKLNAYTAVMGAEITDAIAQANADDAVRAIVLTGAGRGFCAGADISGGAESFGAAGPNFAAPDRPRDGAGFVGALFDSAKPTIAAINGPAVGVGITLTLPCDIRIASDTAKIGFVFARRGLVPEAGSAWFLPQLVGLPQALRWCLSGRVFDAAEALAGGLVSEVLAPDALLPRARAIAQEIADHTAPVSIALTRQMLWRFAGAPLPFDLLAVDGPFAQRLGAGPDVREGVAAFLEKRAPAFPGRIATDMPKGYPWW